MPEADATDAQNAAYALIGRSIPLGDGPQMQVVLYDELGLMPLNDEYRTDTGTLETLFARTGHPFIGHVLTYRRSAITKTAALGKPRPALPAEPDEAEVAAIETLQFIGEVTRAIRHL